MMDGELKDCKNIFQFFAKKNQFFYERRFLLWNLKQNFFTAMILTFAALNVLVRFSVRTSDKDMSKQRC